MKRLVLISLLGLIFLVSCKKENAGPGTVGVTVINAKGVPIQNCAVLLSVPIPDATQYYGTTDVDGYVEFQSGLHVYYDVTVWKGLWEGCDFVEIKPGNTFQKNVIIYPPTSSFNGCL